MNADGTPSIDAAGNYLDTYQTINGQRHYYNPTQNYVNYGFGRVLIGPDPKALLIDSIQPQDSGFIPSPVVSLGAGLTTAPTPPQFLFNFDTIGQVIFRSIGHCRLPVRVIWAQGINESGDASTSNTQTFAGALCSPIDTDEEIDVLTIWDAGRQVYGGGLPLSPVGWTPTDVALLNASLSNMVVYPGDESQLPAPLIVADKGADKTNAFRHLRYIIFPDYPIGGGKGGGASGAGLPQLSVVMGRSNPGGSPATSPDDDGPAVNFKVGAG